MKRTRMQIMLTSALVLVALVAVAPLMCQLAKAQTLYSVTIQAWDYLGGWQVPVRIYRDGVDTGFNTPATFIDQTGTHTYTVPSTNSAGHPFSDWDVGGNTWTDPTLTVSSGGTYTARYRAGYSVTIWGWDYQQGWSVPVPITKDGVSTDFSTPHTFTDLTGLHTFSVPYTNSVGHPFSDWSNDWTDPTLTVSSAGVYTARYREGYSVTIRALCSLESWISRPISIDSSPTGYNTPHTFYLTGTHTISVPGVDELGHLFFGWNEGLSSSPTLTVSSAGVFTARYSKLPEGSLSINDGAEYTSSATVNIMLTVDASTGNGPVSTWQLRLSNDGIWDTEPWQPITISSWTLTPGDGAKTVYLQLKDGVGLVSQTYSDSIILDTVVPTGQFTINNYADYTNSTTVNISWSTISCGISNISQARYSNDGVWDNEPWENISIVNPHRSWTLSSEDGSKTVYCQLKSGSGTVSSTISDSIILDTFVPSGSIYVSTKTSEPYENDIYTSSKSVTIRWVQILYGAEPFGYSVRYSNDGASWTQWEGFGVVKSWTLSAGDGTKTVYCQLKSRVDIFSSIISDSIILDTTPPTGSILINGGAASTTSTFVTLSLICSDITSGVSQVRYSNDGTTWTAWEAPAASKSWTLTPGEGTRTVYYQVKDNAELTSTAYSDSIVLQSPADTTPPIGSIIINGGAATTSLASVTLTLSATDAESGVSQMCFSNDASSWSTWETYATSRSWWLAPGDGLKTVYVQFKNGAGLDSASYSDSITLQSPVDTTPPTGAIIINAGAASTSSTSVTLTLSASDAESGVAQMRFSNDGASWSTWESYATSKSWTLSSGDGTKTVYAQFKNGAGLDSISYSDFITLQSTSADTTPPTGSITISGGAASTNSVSVTLTLVASDNSGVVAQMRFANMGESWATWEPYATSKAWTLTPGNGEKTVLVQFKDGSGIESAPYGDTILLDTSFSERTFNVTVGSGVYVVTTRSNSSTSDFSFNQVLKRIRFTTNGTTGTTCFCNVTIPATLMSGNFSLFIDDTQLAPNTDYTQTYNGTHYTLSMNHAIGSHTAEIFSTNVIPEFPPTAVLSLLVIFASAMTLGLRRKIERKNLLPLA